ncbi:hypothetical protein [Acinetobacter lactucae]|uniref:hypothetical protein n=1 Tax=Acinetobacter lactucae TaxID=1785128 RepID=UPI0039F72624
MRELTISELSVVSGGNVLGRVVTDIIVGWSGEEAAKSAADLLAMGIDQLRDAVADYNSKNPVPISQQDIENLENVLKEAAEEREKSSTDYCGCGGGYSD